MNIANQSDLTISQSHLDACCSTWQVGTAQIVNPQLTLHVSHEISRALQVDTDSHRVVDVFIEGFWDRESPLIEVDLLIDLDHGRHGWVEEGSVILAEKFHCEGRQLMPSRPI